MKKMLINASQPEERRIAFVEDINNYSKLYNLIIQRVGSEEKTGNIYLGRVSSIAANLDAIFVDYGGDKPGFLPFKEVSEEYYLEPYDPNSNQLPDLNKIMKVGQELIVRIIKDERGNKGAALSTYISLAGAYLVLMPNNPRAGISRRIEGEDREEIRDRLNQLNFPDSMGVIVRTAGIDRSVPELQWDLDVLQKHYQSIKDAAKERRAPFLIHLENNPILQSIRDNLMDISEILIDEKETFEKAKQYILQIRPDFVDKIHLYTEKIPLFTKYQLEHQIESAFKRTVQLRSGGTIVFDQTEGGMMIDVNSAGTKDSNLEKTAFRTNLEAAEEIARQLRLRDIGGLIVIDFIDMTSVRNQREVESTIMNAVKPDRARIHINRISRFGLLEMSRQRERKSLKEVSQHVCPTCNGHGTVRSIETICLSIMRLISEEVIKPKTAELHVQVSTEVATYILNEKRGALYQVESEEKIRLLIIPNPNLQNENYDIKRIREGDRHGSSHSPSYKSVKLAEANTDITERGTETRVIEGPAVEQTYPQRPEEDSMLASTSGLIKKLWSSMFGLPGEEKQEVSQKTNERAPIKQRTQSPQRRPQQPRPPRPQNAARETSRDSNSTTGTPSGPSSRSRSHRSSASNKGRNNPRSAPGPKRQQTGYNAPSPLPPYADSTPEVINTPLQQPVSQMAPAPQRPKEKPPIQVQVQPQEKRPIGPKDDSAPVVIRAFDKEAEPKVPEKNKEDVVE